MPDIYVSDYGGVIAAKKAGEITRGKNLSIAAKKHKRRHVLFSRKKAQKTQEKAHCLWPQKGAKNTRSEKLWIGAKRRTAICSRSVMMTSTVRRKHPSSPVLDEELRLIGENVRSEE